MTTFFIVVYLVGLAPVVRSYDSAQAACEKAQGEAVAQIYRVVVPRYRFQENLVQEGHCIQKQEFIFKDNQMTFPTDPKGRAEERS